jgi:hypothetical protein
MTFIVSILMPWARAICACQISEGHDQKELVDVHGLVCAAQNHEVHRPEGDLRQNTGEDGGDSEHRMQEARHEACQEPCRDRDRQGRVGGEAGEDEHDRHGTSGGKAAVDRQIGKVQQAEGDEDAKGHYAPDDPLRNVARKSRQQMKRMKRGKIRQQVHSRFLSCDDTHSY